MVGSTVIFGAGRKILVGPRDLVSQVMTEGNPSICPQSIMQTKASSKIFMLTFTNLLPEVKVILPAVKILASCWMPMENVETTTCTSTLPLAQYQKFMIYRFISLSLNSDVTFHVNQKLFVLDWMAMIDMKARHQGGYRS